MFTTWQHGAAVILLFLIVAVSTTTTSATTSVTPATTMLTTGTDPNVTITLDSFPQGAELITVDGNMVVTPTVFSWQIGSTHNVSAVSSLSCGPSCRFVFEAWSDGGQQTHTITAPNSSWTYMVVYQQQYLLTIKSRLEAQLLQLQDGRTPTPKYRYLRRQTAASFSFRGMGPLSSRGLVPV